MPGKRVRLERLRHPESQRSVLLPLDHGVTVGVVAGLERPGDVIRVASEAGCQAVVAHKGVLSYGESWAARTPSWILHVSASTTIGPTPDKKVLVATVEEAVRLGADGVSVHVNMTSGHEPEMLYDLGTISERCQYWGMPLLAMMYVRGGSTNARDLNQRMCHAARLAAELGADLVKVPYPGSTEEFAKIVEGCFVPVLIAGGERAANVANMFDMVRESIRAGGGGVCIGRNVFQHPDPGRYVRALGAIVHHGASVAEALRILQPNEFSYGLLAAQEQP